MQLFAGAFQYLDWPVLKVLARAFFGSPIQLEFGFDAALQRIDRKFIGARCMVGLLCQVHSI